MRAIAITGRKVVVCLVGRLLFAATVHAEDKGSKQLDTAEAYRECSLAQKVDPRTPTAAGKRAARFCVMLGMAYEGEDGNENHVDESGKPIPINYNLAAQYYTIACKLKVAFGCMAMGRLIENGHVTVAKRQDPRSIALTWYAKGCFSQDKETSEVALSCSFGGGVAMTLGVEKKDNHALAKWMKVGLQLNERACQLGNDASCQTLVKMEQAFSSLGK